jgi:hypothetical protein
LTISASVAWIASDLAAWKASEIAGESSMVRCQVTCQSAKSGLESVSLLRRFGNREKGLEGEKLITRFRKNISRSVHDRKVSHDVLLR